MREQGPRGGSLLSYLLARVPVRALRAVGRWRWAGPLRRQVAHAASAWLRHREVVIPHGIAAGLRFNAEGANAGYALGTSEPAVQRELATVLHPGAVFWDVGANVGFFTVMGARLVGPTGRVVAFEPVPDSARAIKRNAERNAMSNVTVIACAACAVTGAAMLSFGGESTQARLVATAAADPGARTLRVSGVRLDEAASAFGVPEPDVVKIDVEGAECDVIRGMVEVMRRHRPIILAEMHGRNAEFADLLQAHGYRLRSVETDAAPEVAPWWAHVLATPT
jgi:FkbM family methyltransferase